MPQSTAQSNNNLLYLLGLLALIVLLGGIAFVVWLNRDRGEVVGDNFQEVATIAINGKLTHVFASRDAEGEGCNYFYSGVDESQFIVVELTGGAFAADGDGFEVSGYTYGTLGNTDDALIFADAPGVYRFTAHNFQICVAADLLTAKADRANLQQPERYPEYAIAPN